MRPVDSNELTGWGAGTVQGVRAISEGELLLTLREAGAFLRASRSTMYRLMASGQLVGHKVGRKWLFYKNDLKALVQRQGKGCGGLNGPTAALGWGQNGPERLDDR